MALWYVNALLTSGSGRKSGLIQARVAQRYNARQGNHTGYHETITLAWVAVVERFLSVRDLGVPESVLAEELLRQCGGKDYLMRFYSRERLFSDEARHGWVSPDLGEIG